MKTSREKQKKIALGEDEARQKDTFDHQGDQGKEQEQMAHPELLRCDVTAINFPQRTIHDKDVE